MSGNGGAFRSKGKWYQFLVDMPDRPGPHEGAAFSFKIGEPIPEEKWEPLGLW